MPRIPAYLRLGWLLAQDPAVPRRGKAALAGALGYAISPIDPLPGLIPVIGQLDDLAVLLFAVRGALASAPAEVADRHLQTCRLSRDGLEADLLTVRATTIWIADRAVSVATHIGKVLIRGISRRLESPA